MKGLCKNKGGFSLLEVVISIALVGLVATPICSSIVLSHRMNAKSEAILQARLAVTAVVEELQAKGYDPDDETNSTLIDHDSATPDNEKDPCFYTITVKDEDGLVAVTTIVKAKEAAQ